MDDLLAHARANPNDMGPLVGVMNWTMIACVFVIVSTKVAISAFEVQKFSTDDAAIVVALVSQLPLNSRFLKFRISNEFRYLASCNPSQHRFRY